MRYFVILITAVILLSCSETVQIRSDTNWKANINGRIIFGYQDMYINLPDEDVHVVIEKTVRHGYIELKITSRNIFGGSETFKETRPFGKIEMVL